MGKPCEPFVGFSDASKDFWPVLLWQVPEPSLHVAHGLAGSGWQSLAIGTLEVAAVGFVAESSGQCFWHRQGSCSRTLTLLGLIWLACDRLSGACGVKRESRFSCS